MEFEINLSRDKSTRYFRKVEKAKRIDNFFARDNVSNFRDLIIKGVGTSKEKGFKS